MNNVIHALKSITRTKGRETTTKTIDIFTLIEDICSSAGN